MEKYFDRDEVRMTFIINDETKLLEIIKIDVRDIDFFPKPELEDSKFKPEISAWLEALQQTIFGFMRQAPRRMEKKPEPDYGPNAIDMHPDPVPVPPSAHEANAIGPIADVVRAVCPKCNTQIPLTRGCCGGKGEHIYRGKCPSCGRPVTMPERMVRK
jgi:hypothetical protein